MNQKNEEHLETTIDSDRNLVNPNLAVRRSVG